MAAGLVPLAQGSDGAGSIRIPSSFCNLFGIKPSRGRVRNSFGQPDQDIIYTCGPLARTVEDAAAMLDVLAGLSVGTPHWAPPPTRTFLELCRRPVARLRVRFTTRTHLAPTHPDVDRAVRRVVALLETMGHVVEEGTMMDGTVEEFLPVWQTIAASAPIHDWDEAQPITRWLAEMGRSVTQAQADEIVRSFGRRVATWFGDADVWITPTVPGPPPKVGAFSALPPATMALSSSQATP